MPGLCRADPGLHAVKEGLHQRRLLHGVAACRVLRLMMLRLPTMRRARGRNAEHDEPDARVDATDNKGCQLRAYYGQKIKPGRRRQEREPHGYGKQAPREEARPFCRVGRPIFQSFQHYLRPLMKPMRNPMPAATPMAVAGWFFTKSLA